MLKYVYVSLGELMCFVDLKGQGHEIRIALKGYNWLGLYKYSSRWTLKKFEMNIYIFTGKWYRTRKTHTNCKCE